MWCAVLPFVAATTIDTTTALPASGFLAKGRMGSRGGGGVGGSLGMIDTGYRD